MAPNPNPNPSRRAVLKSVGLTALVAGSGLAVVPRNAAAKPRADVVFDVLDYGAVGDGTTDDTAAFQAAIDAIGDAGGGTLLIPARTYVLASAAADSCVIIGADNMTVRADGATIMRPDKFNSAIFVVNTRRTEPLGYGAGVRHLKWHGGKFVGNISESNVLCAFSLHHAQNCTFEEITFENCQAKSSHMFDMVGADNITIKNCRFLGQQARADTANVAEAVQIGASYKGGLTGGTENYGFSGLMSRNITIENCHFLPFDGQAGPTPFGYHGGVEGKFHQRLRFLHNVVVDPRTSLVPPDGPNGTVNRGAVHLSDGHDVQIIGNKFRQTQGRVNRAITIMSFDNGVLTGADPDHPTRGDFAAPQGPANVTIQNNTIEGFPAHADYDAIYVHGLDGTAVPGVAISGNTITGGYDSSVSEHGAAVHMGNLDAPVITDNEIVGYYLGIDLADGPIDSATVTGNTITNTTSAAFPAAIIVDVELTDSTVTDNLVFGYLDAVSGDPGSGTVVDKAVSRRRRGPRRK